jgi:hypothetical protein
MFCIKNQSILHTRMDLSEKAGFIDVPRLNFRRVFPYTRQSPHPTRAPRPDGGERLLRFQSERAPNSRLCTGRGRHFKPRSNSSAARGVDRARG